ncbi:MAG: nucleotide-binding protein [Lachnospiraceae bacterium]|nr:nucleotide-binding protein [Lachnospiraceae bacterium]
MDAEKGKNYYKLEARARQNVVFVHGYLIAKLGGNQVVAIVKGDIETQGDTDDIVYINMDEGGG